MKKSTIKKENYLNKKENKKLLLFLSNIWNQDWNILTFLKTGETKMTKINNKNNKNSKLN